MDIDALAIWLFSPHFDTATNAMLYWAQILYFFALSAMKKRRL